MKIMIMDSGQVGRELSMALWISTNSSLDREGRPASQPQAIREMVREQAPHDHQRDAYTAVDLAEDNVASFSARPALASAPGSLFTVAYR